MISCRAADRPIGQLIAIHWSFRQTVYVGHTVGGVALQIVDGVFPIIGVSIHRFLPLNIRLIGIFDISKLDCFRRNRIVLAALALGIALQSNLNCFRPCAVNEGTVAIVVPILFAGDGDFVRLIISIGRAHVHNVIFLIKGIMRNTDYIASSII